jgi:hypothetical protein
MLAFNLVVAVDGRALIGQCGLWNQQSFMKTIWFGGCN